MPLGLVVLFAVAALVYFGLAHRVLDRMRLTDTQALAFLGLMVAGSFVTIPLSENERAATVSVNVGGACIPLALAVYLLAKAGTRTEVVRALASAAGTAAGIVLVSMYIDTPPHDRELWIDPVWLYSLLGGVLAYAAGRSRRGAFVAGTLGVLLADVVHLFPSRRAACGARLRWAAPGSSTPSSSRASSRSRSQKCLERVESGCREGRGKGKIAPRPSCKTKESQATVAGGINMSRAAAILGILLLACATCAAQGFQPGAEELSERIDGGYFRFLTESGRTVAESAVVVGVGDSYINEENRLFEVVAIDGDLVTVADRGVVEMPDVSDALAAMERAKEKRSPSAFQGWAGRLLARVRGEKRNLIGIYHTHNAESYVPTSGIDSKEYGDIHEVGKASPRLSKRWASRWCGGMTATFPTTAKPI